MRYVVQVYEGGGWVDCVREDLLDSPSYSGDSRFLPRAEFPTSEKATSFIETLRGLMHCGGTDTVFRVLVTR